jgi:hypothetical protein
MLLAVDFAARKAAVSALGLAYLSNNHFVESLLRTSRAPRYFYIIKTARLYFAPQELLKRKVLEIYGGFRAARDTEIISRFPTAALASLPQLDFFSTTTSI